MKKFGSLTVNCGGMFSGKSTELQRQGERHILAGHKVVYVKPSIDNRYSKSKIVTHKGNSVKAINISITDVLTHIKEVQEAEIILIDEVQFFDHFLVIEIESLLAQGKIVYCSGLDMDYNGIEFEVMAKLLCRADNINKFHAVCEGCGEDAVFSAQRTPEKRHYFNSVNIGGTEEYVPLCRECYDKWLD